MFFPRSHFDNGTEKLQCLCGFLWYLLLICFSYIHVLVYIYLEKKISIQQLIGTYLNFLSIGECIVLILIICK